jgi:hypothetical protein
MAAASERVCPLPQTRTGTSISQIPHIAQAQEHAKRAKEVVVESENRNRTDSRLTWNWAGRVCRSLSRVTLTTNPRFPSCSRRVRTSIVKHLVDENKVAYEEPSMPMHTCGRVFKGLRRLPSRTPIGRAINVSPTIIRPCSSLFFSSMLMK